MKKSWIVIGVIVVLVFIIYRLFAGSYNNMVSKEEDVKSQWAQVENAYQVRSDLIPNLVNTVKGAANFEQQTLIGVIEARAKATQVKIDANNLTEDKFKEFEQAQRGVSSALSRLLVTVEAYPDLKANQNFRALMDELSGTERRISTERKRFNDVVQDYNSHIRSFPNNLFAGMFGFTTKAYFQATEGSEKAPEVKF
jgi:LemA protein